MPLFFILFIIIPVSEIALLIKVGGIIGAGYTILMIFLTALVGATLLRRQGISTLLRANQRLNAGEIPAQEMVEGFLLALGGALLLTPGFITDLMGFLLVIPWIRALAIKSLSSRIKVQSMGAGSFYQNGFGKDAYSGRSPFQEHFGDDAEIIEGEYQDISPDKNASQSRIAHRDQEKS